jgi:hypothetical protein
LQDLQDSVVECHVYDNDDDEVEDDNFVELEREHSRFEDDDEGNM